MRAGDGTEPRAQALAGPVRDLLRQMQKTLDTEPQFDLANADRLFRIAATDYVVAVMLHDIIAKARVTSPRLSFQIEPIIEGTWARLSNGELDFCITTRPGDFYPGDPGAHVRFQHELILEDPFVCLVDKNHPLVDDVIGIEQLKALPQVMVRFGQNMKTSNVMAWHTVDFEPEVIAAVPSFLAAAQLIPTTDMVAMIPRRLAKILVQQLPVKYVECPITFPLLREMMLWHDRSCGDPAHIYMRECFREFGKNLPPDQSAQ